MSSIPEEYIVKSFQKTATEEEISFLNNWLREDKQHVELYCQMEEIWNSKSRLPDNFVQEGWDKLREEIHSTRQARQSVHSFRKRNRFVRLRYVAAVFTGILIASAAWIGFRLHNDRVEKDVSVRHVVFNHNGVQSVQLPDNSEVWLNEDTELRYPGQFEKERVVSLKGKAFFDIRKEIGQPFVVQMGNAEVIVAGTEFFVEYTSEENILVALLSGKVQVNYTDENGVQISSSLIPGQQADINRLNGKILISEVDTCYYRIWKDGTYRFTDEPLDVIVGLLSKRYNLDIQVSSFLQKKRFTGRITPKDDISDVMNMINKSFPVKYEITDGKIKISEL
jgi:ferric-dicitrate binding protein FerR (iron transport regulator)